MKNLILHYSKNQALMSDLFSELTVDPPRIDFASEILFHPFLEGDSYELNHCFCVDSSNKINDASVHQRAKINQLKVSCDSSYYRYNDCLETIKGKIFIFGGILHQHFGHFMAESIHRLWYYSQIKHLQPIVVFSTELSNFNSSKLFQSSLPTITYPPTMKPS